MTELDTFQAGLMRIRQRFLQSLDTHSDGISRLSKALGKPDTDQETCAEIRTIAHRLHGTAKTVGFDEIGTKAANLEICVSQALSATAVPDVNKVRRLLEDLSDEIEVALRSS
ncbi:Hpt domain-containing protein [Pseudorhodobacter wandonensis]|jgi:chemotaxis protein histidine kinase CheA|uniref:Hpt domain-containing protein n=1 Tax=Pseudorhodobacter wandonensis TaxID=1120568 RepID=UPI00067D2CF8|nr:Hpt domain-containing protein [Pseudorhodobacter wandonensis]